MKTRIFDSIQEKNENIQIVAMMVFFFFAPFSVSAAVQKITPVPTSVLVSFLVAGTLFMIFILSKPKTLYWDDLLLQKKLIIVSMFIVPIISVLGTLYNLQFMYSVEYIEYVKKSLPTRVINLSFFFIIFYIFNKKISSLEDRSLLMIVKGYLLSVFIIIIFGIWQFLYFTAEIPMIGLDTRSFVHSVEEDVLFNFRLTSLVDEPSYMVPILIDGLIIGLIVFRNSIKRFFFVFALPCLFVLVFSFSVSGFANIGLIVMFTVFLLLTSRIKNKKRIILYLIFAFMGLLILSFFLRDYLIEFLMPIIGRFDTLLDIHKHSRLYQTVMPFFWVTDYSIVNMLIGFGPGSYEFLHMTKFLHYEVPLSTTSNNMWIDLLYEYGILGFLAFFGTYLSTFYLIFKRRMESRYFLFSLLLWFHLGITSIYRSDFASPRFWILVITAWILYELGKREKFKKEIR